MVKTVVYTAIFGGYDRLREPEVHSKDIDYICFTDDLDLRSDVWEIRVLAEPLRCGSPVLTARMVKICPHRFLSGYEYSLWVDSNMTLKAIPDVEKMLDGKTIATTVHPERDCVFAEGAACIEKGKAGNSKITGQLASYRKIGHPEHAGLYQTGIIAREHGNAELEALSETWWWRIQEYSPRDQISFPVAFADYPIKKLSMLDWENLIWLSSHTCEVAPGATDRKVSIVIPIIRPEGARRCIEAIRRYAPSGQYEIVAEQDVDGIGCPRMIERLVEKTKYDLVMYLGDDSVPQIGFFNQALEAMASLPDGWGLVGLWCGWGVEFSHFLCHKNMLEHIPGGCFFPTDYNHIKCDRELCDIARELGRWARTQGKVIEHLHPSNKTAEMDAAYKRSADPEKCAADVRTYQRRKQARIRARGERRLSIAWPITNNVMFSDFALSYAMLQKPPHSFLFPNMANQMDLQSASIRAPMDKIKNSLVDRALTDGCTDLLTMDTDQVYLTHDMIPRMVKWGKPIVAAKVHRRYPPFDPIMLQFDKTVDGENHFKCMPYDDVEAAVEAGGLCKVDVTGTGCVLYDTQVFFDIEPPWYEFWHRKDGKRVSCDCAFHEKVMAAGIPIYMDMDIDIEHMSVKGIGMGEYRIFNKLYGGQENGE